jgi:hypothetical protein
LALYTITYGDDDIECIECHRLIRMSKTQKLRVAFFF